MNTNESAPKKQGSCQLTSLETRVLGKIFTTILEFGKAPTIDELEQSLKKSAKVIIRVLDKLEDQDLLVRKKGTQKIVSIYPLSLVPTKHQIALDEGKKIFAMCAIDAVGAASMFNRNVRVISQCEWCRRKISIEIKNEEIVKTTHPHVLIWSPKLQKKPEAETCCPMTNFFCSNEHLKKWGTKNPILVKKGHSVVLEKAYPRIKECWKHYGETIGVREKNPGHLVGVGQLSYP